MTNIYENKDRYGDRGFTSCCGAALKESYADTEYPVEVCRNCYTDIDDEGYFGAGDEDAFMRTITDAKILKKFVAFKDEKNPVAMIRMC